MRKPFFIVHRSQHLARLAVYGLMLALLAAPVCAFAATLPAGLPRGLASQYEAGVAAYKNGEYDKAYKQFRALSQSSPEVVEVHYYLAISLAQLGRTQEARQAYQTVIRLAPQDEVAGLAQEGLSYLPQDDELDAPPRIRKNAAGESVGQSNTGQAATNPFGQMDPQAMQMMMLMGGMGGGGGGFNPMMLPMMQSMMRGNSGKPGDPDSDSTIPPQVMSTIMMNQMMQEMGSFGSNKD